MSIDSFFDLALLRASDYGFQRRNGRSHDFILNGCSQDVLLGLSEVSDRYVSVTDAHGLRAGIAIDDQSQSFIAWRDGRAVVCLNADEYAIEGALKAIIEAV